MSHEGIKAMLKVGRAIERGTIEFAHLDLWHSSVLWLGTLGSAVPMNTLEWAEKNFPGGSHRRAPAPVRIIKVRGPNRRIKRTYWEIWEYSTTGIKVSYLKEHLVHDGLVDGLRLKNGYVEWRCRDCGQRLSKAEQKEKGLA